jgi:hypothetical protein
MLTVAMPPMVRADGLFYRVPKDGTWAEYHVSVKEGRTPQGDKGSLTIRSVGSKEVKGKPHRWIELVVKITGADGNEQVASRRTIKLLVPEENFALGKDPLSGVDQIWTKRGDAAPQNVADKAETQQNLVIFFAGPLQEVKKPELKREVQWRRGKLTCQEIHGTVTAEGPPSRSDQTIILKQKVALHEETPFGFAEMNIEASMRSMEGIEREPATLLFSLTDMGTDAKSALPDVK